MAETSKVEQTPAPAALNSLLNWELKGQIWNAKTGGGVSVEKPGGRNFGGILQAQPEIAIVNGRTIVVAASYDPDGLRRLESLSGSILTAYHLFLTDPMKHTLQTVSFDGVSRKVRFVKEPKSDKGPQASYYLTI